MHVIELLKFNFWVACQPTITTIIVEEDNRRIKKSFDCLGVKKTPKYYLLSSNY